MIFLDTSSAIEILNGAVTLENVLIKFKTDKFGITIPSIFELYSTTVLCLKLLQ